MAGTASRVLLTLFFCVPLCCAAPTVTTKSGKVAGTRQLYKRQAYEEFLGIPFAEPPVGQLRWKAPQPVTPWDGVRNATSFSISCTQFISRLYGFIGLEKESGEDCLYLNVWVPKGVEANSGRKLPVMLWIYGGAYVLGTGSMYPGYALALHGDVIVVNFNYRVSTLGWLSTGDAALPGNYGLWDIEAALTWVKENIAAFSGDPDKVTVFGQSAGAALTSHSVISPKTRDLFQNAIAVSGASAGFFGLQPYPLRTAALLADIFECGDVKTTTEIVDCLRDVPAAELDFWGFAGQLSVQQRLPNFAPVVDGDIVPTTPSDAWQRGDGRHINFITGYTDNDAAGLVLMNPIAFPLLGDRFNMAQTQEKLDQSLKVLMGGTTNADELIAYLFRRYPDMVTEDDLERTIAATKSMTDWWFGSGSNWEANQHALYGSTKNAGSTYQYQFHHRQSFLVGYPDWVNGSHVDDIYSFFGDAFMERYRRLVLRRGYSADDRTISETLMNYFSNFAHSGNPNVGPNKVALEWTKFDNARQNYLLEAPKFSMEEFDAKTTDNFAYWNGFLANAQFPPEPSFPLVLDEDIKASEKYFFTDLTNRYRLTKSDVERGVGRLRRWLRTILDGNREALADMESMIDGMVARRR